jgi:hypothetical protein
MINIFEDVEVFKVVGENSATTIDISSVSQED